MLFFTQLSYHLMWKLMKKSWMLSSTQVCGEFSNLPKTVAPKNHQLSLTFLSTNHFSWQNYFWFKISFEKKLDTNWKIMHHLFMAKIFEMRLSNPQYIFVLTILTWKAMFLGSDSFFIWVKICPNTCSHTDYTVDQKERKAPSMKFNFVSYLMYSP